MTDRDELFDSYLARFKELAEEAATHGLVLYAGSDCCGCSRGYAGLFDNDSELANSRYGRFYDPEYL